MGKNFSCNNLGQRRASDFYETPYSITQQLLDRETFEKNATTLEPACGNGAILSVLHKNGMFAWGYDVETDFLKETRQVDQIITNPPFSLALEFIKQAKEIVRCKFAFLLPLSYLHGKKRLDEIYTNRVFPLAKVYVSWRGVVMVSPGMGMQCSEYGVKCGETFVSLCHFERCGCVEVS